MCAQCIKGLSIRLFSSFLVTHLAFKKEAMSSKNVKELGTV